MYEATFKYANRCVGVPYIEAKSLYSKTVSQTEDCLPFFQVPYELYFQSCYKSL